MKNTEDKIIFKDILTTNHYTVPPIISKKWQLYRHRYTLSLSMGVLLWSFKLPTLVSIVIPSLFAIISEYMFRIKFIPMCTPTQKPISIKPHSNISISLLTFILFLIASLLFFIMYTQKLGSTFSNTFNLLASISLAIAAMFQLFLLIKNKKT